MKALPLAVVAETLKVKVILETYKVCRTHVEMWASGPSDVEFSIRDRGSGDVGNSTSDSRLVSVFVETEPEVNGVEQISAFSWSVKVDGGINSRNIPINIFYWKVDADFVKSKCEKAKFYSLGEINSFLEFEVGDISEWGEVGRGGELGGGCSFERPLELSRGVWAQFNRRRDFSQGALKI